LQVDEVTDVVKGAHLITYIEYVLENEIKEFFSRCNAIVGRIALESAPPEILVRKKAFVLSGRIAYFIDRCLYLEI
jgi:hypothetical protein